MFEAKNISFSHDRPIVERISLKVQPGETLGIIGKSGAGKTTLLKILGGILPPMEGTLILNGEKLKNASGFLVPGYDNIKLVNQDYDLDIYHTVQENIREKILYLPNKLRERWVKELLALIEMTELATQQAISLSGGEKQRLALARALACEPDVLLLDEPFANLDRRLRLKFTNYIQQIQRERGMMVVLVSHEGGEVLQWSNKVAFLKNGKFRRVVSSDSAYYKYQTLEEGELLGWVNVTEIGGKRVTFRPDEYNLSTGSDTIQVLWENAQFDCGIYWNFFRDKQDKLIVLVSQNKLHDVQAISINHK